ncbi:MAG: hypothetical protein K6T91_00930 [Firmicutes bacterium]|nr:hypothetical protein [Bacillota bacterium]
MAARTNAPMWTIIYAVLFIAVVLALLQLFGILALTPVTAGIINILLIFSLIVVVFHLVRLI